MVLNPNDAPAGFVAVSRFDFDDECKACAFYDYPESGNFIACRDKSGNRCSPSCRDDKHFVVFVKS